jgi:PAS domain S-box-containing protein
MLLSSGLDSSHILNYALRLRQRPLIAYPVLIAAIAIATLARWLLDGQTVAGPFVTYYPVIITAALLGGFWTGLVSIVCSGFLGWYVFLAAASPLLARDLSAPSLLTFIILALLDVAIASIVNKAVNRLTEQEKNVRSMVEGLPNGVMVINRQGIITSVNAALEQIFRYTRSELVGLPILTLVPDRFRERHLPGMAAYLKNPQPRGLGPNREFKGKRKDGSEATVEVGLTPIERHGERAVVATVIDITQRIRAQEREKLLARELQHRTQNLFLVIQAIVGRTLVQGQSVEDAKRQLTGRLNALAGAHSSLLGSFSDGVSLAEILHRELSGIAPKAVTVTGCDVVLNADAAQQFALIIHELATNAVKYGALSRAEGRVAVSGLITETADAKTFSLVWTERGGSLVERPTRRGFGSSILFEAAQQFGMVVEADYPPEGLVYSLRIALEDITPLTVQIVPSEAPVIHAFSASDILISPRSAISPAGSQTLAAKNPTA